MSNLARNSVSIDRVGEEEFGIPLHGAVLSKGQAFIDRLQAQLSALSIPGISNGTMTVRARVAECYGRETRECWFERADKVLYAAKRSGRNRVVASALTGEIMVTEIWRVGRARQSPV